jgi:hypothetical protein
MLKQLSGRRHQVITAVCICFKGMSFSHIETTDVEFDHLPQSWIDVYVASGEPMYAHFLKNSSLGIRPAVTVYKGWPASLFHALTAATTM